MTNLECDYSDVKNINKFLIQNNCQIIIFSGKNTFYLIRIRQNDPAPTGSALESLF